MQLIVNKLDSKSAYLLATRLNAKIFKRNCHLLFKFNHLPLGLPLLAQELLLLLLQPPPDPLLVLHDPVQGVGLLTHRLTLAPLSRVEQALHV